MLTDILLLSTVYLFMCFKVFKKEKQSIRAHRDISSGYMIYTICIHLMFANRLFLKDQKKNICFLDYAGSLCHMTTDWKTPMLLFITGLILLGDDMLVYFEKNKINMYKLFRQLLTFFFFSFFKSQTIEIKLAEHKTYTEMKGKTSDINANHIWRQDGITGCSVIKPN